jgi:hypothetical protein
VADQGKTNPEETTSYMTWYEQDTTEVLSSPGKVFQMILLFNTLNN